MMMMFLYRNSSHSIETSLVSNREADQQLSEKFLVFFIVEWFDKKHMMTCKLLSHMPNTF